MPVSDSEKATQGKAREHARVKREELLKPSNKLGTIVHPLLQATAIGNAIDVQMVSVQ